MLVIGLFCGQWTLALLGSSSCAMTGGYGELVVDGMWRIEIASSET